MRWAPQRETFASDTTPCPQYGTHSLLAFELVLRHILLSAFFLKPTVSIRPSVPHSGSHKCLRFGLWSTLCIIKYFYLLTYLLIYLYGWHSPRSGAFHDEDDRPIVFEFLFWLEHVQDNVTDLTVEGWAGCKIRCYPAEFKPWIHGVNKFAAITVAATVSVTADANYKSAAVILAFGTHQHIQGGPKTAPF